MFTHKKVAWESWNARVEELLLFSDSPDEIIVDQITAQAAPEHELIMPFQPKMLHTPLGIFPEESTLKPSDRWDCWLGYTNFGITRNIKDILDNEIDGIEALKVLGKYTFFIGVGKMFDISDVRKATEEKLCAYTEQEILSNKDTQQTVDLVKEQLQTNKYWSMLVSPEGKVEYIVSDAMDKIYLDGLNDLLELKHNIGGIILRGQNG